MGRVWLEAHTLAHTERAVPLSKIHCDLEKNQPPEPLEKLRTALFTAIRYFISYVSNKALTLGWSVEAPGAFLPADALHRQKGIF